jgi:hypothetical protein
MEALRVHVGHVPYEPGSLVFGLFATASKTRMKEPAKGTPEMQIEIWRWRLRENSRSVRTQLRESNG